MLTLILPIELVIVIGVAVLCVWVLTLAAGFIVASRADVLGSRGEAAERSDEEESFDLAVDEAVLLTHETADEEDNQTAADFLLWADEIAQDGRIAKHLRRMERWSK